MRPGQMPRQPDEGPQPLSLMVPIYNKTEVDLMGALEFVIEGFAGPPPIDAPPMPTPPGISRAVDWLHAKYGTRVAT